MTTALLPKKERKQLRKQMLERKQQLLAKHGRSGGRHSAASVSTSVTSSSSPCTSANPRTFGEVKPKLPGDPPLKGPANPLPRWTPPTQPAPARSLAAGPLAQTVFTCETAEDAETLDSSVPVAPPCPPSLIPKQAAASPVSHIAGLDLPAAGPGPLTRAAVVLENAARQTIRLLRERPWQCPASTVHPVQPRRADVHRNLALLVKPLRFLGCVLVAGAIVLGRESRDLGVSVTGSLVVLGTGLALAVVLFTLAELTQALRTLLRAR